MSQWASWIRQALEPSPQEVERVKSGLDAALLGKLADATAPTEDEVHRLIVSRTAWAEQRARRRWIWAAGALVPMGGVALVAAALLIWVLLPPAYGPVPAPIGAEIALRESTPLRLGPSIEVVAVGTLVVEQADTAGTELALVEGRGLFEVDPNGSYRHLVIHAGDVDVEVKGTRFTVERSEEGVSVSVLRGLVEVRHGGETVLLPAGERWAEPEVAMVDVPAREERVLAEPPIEAPAPEPAVVDAVATAPVPPAEPQGTPEAPPVEDEVAPSVELAYSTALAALEARLGTADPPTVAEIDALRTEAGPAHPVWHDAGVLRLRVRADGDPLGALIEMESWLAVHSDSPRRVEVLWLHAETARGQLGPCDRGLKSYVELTRRIEAPARAEAAAYRGLCAARDGDVSTAPEWLDDALQGELSSDLRAEVQAARAALP